MIYIYALIAGLILGAAFAFLKLPIPAPGSLAGVVGILGVTLGYMLITNPQTWHIW